MAGKYIPFEKYLLELPKSQRDVTLRFEEIEGILNGTLPASAYEDRRWWDHEKEGNHINARAWANAGGQLLPGGLELHTSRASRFACALPL